MRTVGTIAFCALAASCGGAVNATDGADASVDSTDASDSPHDASHADGSDVATQPDARTGALPPIDAGTVDGGDIWCGSVDGAARHCVTPQEYCCVDDVAGALTYRCESPAAPVRCGGMLFCDDRADCPSGAICCIGGDTFGGRVASGCSTQHCRDWRTVPNTWAAEMCDVDASPTECNDAATCQIGAVGLGEYAACQ